MTSLRFGSRKNLSTVEARSRLSRSSGTSLSSVKPTWVDENILKLECSHYIPSRRSLGRCGCGRKKEDHDYTLELSRTGSTRITNNRWKVKHHTAVFPTDAYGTVEFQGGPHPFKSRYLRLHFDTKPEDILHLLLHEWRLQVPNLVISVLGGLANFDLQPKLKRVFQDGLVKAARTTGAWIITTGLDIGVTKHVGDALSEQIHIRGSKIVALGIAPWGVVQHKENMIGKEHTCPYYSISSSTHNQAVLNQDHNYFLLADNGTSGKYGAEIYLRRRLEQYLAQQPIDMRRFGGTKSRVPVVAVLVEGGMQAFRMVFELVTDKNPVPVVVCDGSGRAADLLAFMHHYANEDGDLSSALKQQIMRTIKRTFSLSTDEANSLYAEMRLCLKRRDLISIFRMGDEVTVNIDVAILTALLHGTRQNLTPAEQLSLTMAWNRPDIARKHIFKCEQEWQPSTLETAMLDALINDRLDFVKLLLEHGVSIQNFLTTSRLEYLYSVRGMKGNESFRRVLSKVLNGKTMERITLRVVGQVIQQLVGSGYQHPYCMKPYRDMEKKKTNPVPSAPYLYSTSSETSEPYRYPYTELLQFALLTRRYEMARFMMLSGEESIAKALLSVKLLRGLRKKLDSDFETEYTNELKKWEEEFEEEAVNMQDHCYAHEPEHAKRLLTYELKAFSKNTCLGLAYMCESKSFLSHVCTQSILNDLWYGGLKESTFMGGKVAFVLLTTVVFPPFLLYVFSPIGKFFYFKTKEELAQQPCTLDEYLDEIETSSSSSSSASSLHSGDVASPRASRRNSEHQNADLTAYTEMKPREDTIDGRPPPDPTPSSVYRAGSRKANITPDALLGHRQSGAGVHVDSEMTNLFTNANMNITHVSSSCPDLVEAMFDEDETQTEDEDRPITMKKIPISPIPETSLLDNLEIPRVVVMGSRNRSNTADVVDSCRNDDSGSMVKETQSEKGRRKRRRKSLDINGTRQSEGGRYSDNQSIHPSRTMPLFKDATGRLLTNNGTLGRLSGNYLGSAYPAYRQAPDTLFPDIIHPEIVPQSQLSPIKKIYEFYSAPITRYYLHLILYIIFLLMFVGLSIITVPNNEICYLELFVYLHIITYFLDKFREVTLSGGITYWQKMKVHLGSFWNQYDYGMCLISIVGIIIRYIGWFHYDYFLVGKNLLIVCCALWMIRVIELMQIWRIVGSYIYMAVRMIRAMFPAVILLFIPLISFGVIRRGIMYPNNTFVTMESVKDLMLKPYFMLYGEVYAGEIDPVDWTDMSGTAAVWKDWDNEAKQWHHTKGSFIPLKELVPITMVLYLLIAIIVMLSIIIAQFNDIFSSVRKQSELVYKYLRYAVIIEYESRPLLPPPLIILSWIYIAVRMLVRKRRRGGQYVDARVAGHSAGLKLFLGHQEIELLHDFEEECVEDYCREKSMAEALKQDKQIRSMYKKVEVLHYRMEEVHQRQTNLSSTVHGIDQEAVTNAERNDIAMEKVMGYLRRLDNKLGNVIDHYKDSQLHSRRASVENPVDISKLSVSAPEPSFVVPTTGWGPPVPPTTGWGASLPPTTTTTGWVASLPLGLTPPSEGVKLKSSESSLVDPSSTLQNPPSASERLSRRHTSRRITRHRSTSGQGKLSHADSTSPDEVSAPQTPPGDEYLDGPNFLLARAPSLLSGRRGRAHRREYTTICDDIDLSIIEQSDSPDSHSTANGSQQDLTVAVKDADLIQAEQLEHAEMRSVLLKRLRILSTTEPQMMSEDVCDYAREVLGEHSDPTLVDNLTIPMTSHGHTSADNQSLPSSTNPLQTFFEDPGSNVSKD